MALSATAQQPCMLDQCETKFTGRLDELPPEMLGHIFGYLKDQERYGVSICMLRSLPWRSHLSRQGSRYGLCERDSVSKLVESHDGTATTAITVYSLDIPSLRERVYLKLQTRG